MRTADDNQKTAIIIVVLPVLVLFCTFILFLEPMIE